MNLNLLNYCVIQNTVIQLYRIIVLYRFAIQVLAKYSTFIKPIFNFDDNFYFHNIQTIINPSYGIKGEVQDSVNWTNLFIITSISMQIEKQSSNNTWPNIALPKISFIFNQHFWFAMTHLSLNKEKMLVENFFITSSLFSSDDGNHSAFHFSEITGHYYGNYFFWYRQILSLL